MRYLLDDRMAPMTSEIGFIEVESGTVARAFIDWQSAIFAPRGVSIESKELGVSTLEAALKCLLPLASIQPTRSVFVPTTGGWTAYFENGVKGTDAMPAMSYLAKILKVRSLRAVAIPDAAANGGRYGATIIEVYGPEAREFLNYVRSVACANDGGKWVFTTAGTPLPFEEPSLYKARRTQDRFTADMLNRYLSAIGISAFDEEFYRCSSATLIEKVGPRPPGAGYSTLEEIRAKFVVA
jgi:hypothetical protein